LYVVIHVYCISLVSCGNGPVHSLHIVHVLWAGHMMISKWLSVRIKAQTRFW